MMNHLGLIGVGRWGINHFRTAKELGVLGVVCDSDPLVREELAKEGIGCVEHVEDVLFDGRITKVAIVTPAPTHYELVKRFLLAGKDVFVEKPLAMKVGEGKELVALAEKHSRILMVGHILLHDHVVEKVLEIVRVGEIGAVWHVKSNRLNFGVIRSEESVLWSFAVHDVSICIAIFGDQMPETVTCTGQAAITGVDDFSTLCLTFKGGATAAINVSWIHPYKHRELIVVGSSGFIVYDAAKPPAEQLKVVRTEMEVRRGRPTDGAKITGEKNVVVPSVRSPLTKEYVHFIECCERRQKPITDGQEALRVLRVLDAADQSRRLERTIRPGEQEFGKGVSKPVVASSTAFFVHETAVVDDGAVIGEGSKVWHFTHVMGGAVLGSNCNLGQNVYIAGTARLGSNVKVQNNVSIYDGVTCNDNVFIGPSAVFTNVKNPRSAIVRKSEYRKTNVGVGASIGANATIICGVNLGRYCLIGAGAVVTKDVKPYRIVYGNPARDEGWISPEGNRLEQAEGADEKLLEDPSTGRRYRITEDDILEPFMKSEAS